MFSMIKDWREQRILDNSEFTNGDWMRAAERIVILDRLNKDEMSRLFELATLFLADKSIKGAQGFEITDTVRQSIALQACLPILNLNLEWYAGWSSIIIYPGSYKSETTTMDEFGIVHEGTQHRSGEACSAVLVFCHGRMPNTQASVMDIMSSFTSSSIRLIC